MVPQKLETESRLPDPDVVYRALIEAHRDLSDVESAALNTRLVLILCNLHRPSRRARRSHRPRGHHPARRRPGVTGDCAGPPLLTP